MAQSDQLREDRWYLTQEGNPTIASPRHRGGLGQRPDVSYPCHSPPPGRRKRNKAGTARGPRG